MKKSGLRYILSCPVEIFNGEDGAAEPEEAGADSEDNSRPMTSNAGS
jgi:hypothetical protein